ncbi:MAG: efflux RND transporter periplasmic adaptor subunit [Blastocatellia bacterium]|nr:efflux RND transporter periplasmic adaptor subunit [Blastocatellia bacterium]
MISPSINVPEQKQRRQALILSTAVLLAILLLIIVFRHQSRHYLSLSLQRSEAAGPPADSPVIEVRRGSLKKTLLLNGELRAVRSHTIYGTTPEDVKIAYLPPEGALVKAGDRLVELDSMTVLNKIKDNEEKIFAAENEIVKLRGQNEGALRDLDIELSKLWLAYEQAKLKAVVPADVQARREYQEAQLALAKAKTEYENQLNKIEQTKKGQAADLQVKIIDVEKLKVQLNRDKSYLNGMQLKAPADGMVIYCDHWNWNERRKLQVGDIVWMGVPIVRLPDLSEMEVLAQVNEVDGPKLSLGSKAEVRLDTYPETVITGAIKEISQTAIKASWMAKAKVFRVVVSLDRTVREIMKPGMSAQVAVTFSETAPQLLVPRSAVRFDGESPTVTRVEDAEAYRPIAVTILSTDALHFLVANNGALKEGDRILSRQ